MMRVLFVLAVLLTAPVQAMDGAALMLELNNTRQMKTDCRVSFLVQNKLTKPISALSLEIVLFDEGSRVDRFMKLKAGRLAVGKMRVRQFDLKNRKCSTLSRILINDIAECTGAGLSAADCLDRLQTSSRVTTKLVK